MIASKQSGEVSAIAGYVFQYEIFATEIYNSLLENNLEWIELASGEAGKLDDVLIGTKDKIIAYQVKNITSSNFSYLDLTKSETESIVEGLFKGWRNLKSKFPGKKIDARFLTTQDLSKNDRISLYKGEKKPSFEQFLANFWKPVQQANYTHETVPSVWRPVLTDLSDKVGASEKEFLEFVKDFRFVFNYKLDFFLYDSYTQAKRAEHITRIVNGITLIVGKQGSVRYSRDQFLSEFGFREQFESRFQHSFFVDEKHYQPLGQTISQLRSITDRKGKGYIALIGNAGSGKSTLLTKWLSDSPHKVLKYYAYTNVEMSYEYGYRGEASYFLHDLLVQLRESGQVHQDRLPNGDLLDLQRHFGKELERLSRHDQKVFIIVDGLDHIGREQRVVKSLIEVLPPPNKIPDNVYFILGSRTILQLDNLSFEIRQSLKDDDSIVSINQLTRQQVNQLCLSFKIQFDDQTLDLLHQNTKGHPLFVRYTIEELNAASPEDYREIVLAKDFGGDIETEYQRFWDLHKTEEHFVHILGLISRFRYPYFDVGLLRSFKIKPVDAQMVNKLSEFYFYKSGNVWQFFHNSFKEFLIAESARDPFTAAMDGDLDAAYHQEIADAINTTTNAYRFNLIYHWFKAGNYRQITAQVSQAFFREQWYAFRNTNIIREDIRLVSQAALKVQDLRVVAVCFFSYLEIDQREVNFKFSEHYDIFLSTGNLDLACSFVFDPAKLLVSQESALDYARHLAQKGHTKLAQELFERASPIHLLSRSKPLSRHRYDSAAYIERDEVELIKKWANTASIFEPIDEIVQRLRKVELEPEREGGSAQMLLPELIFSLADFLSENKRHQQLAELEVHAKNELEEFDQFDFYYDLVYQQNVPDYLRSLTRDFFEKWIDDGDNGHRLRFALYYTYIDSNSAKRQWAFDMLEKPDQVKKRLSRIRVGGMANYIFNYARLYYIVTKDFARAPETFVPASDKPTEKAFELAFAKMGLAHAWYFHGYPEASTGFFTGVERLFDIFHHDFNTPLHEYEISNDKGRFINQILGSSIDISPDTTLQLLSKLTREWQLHRTYWSHEDVHEVVSWIIESRVDDSWCENTLNWLDQTTLWKGTYRQTILENGARQARLWVKLGKPDKAERCINKLMRLSFGMASEEDVQVSKMVSWLKKFDPTPTEDIQFYLDRLPSILATVSSKWNTPAETILELSLPFRNGFAVLNHLLFGKLVSLIDGVDSILTYLAARNPTWHESLIKLFTRVIVALDNPNSTRRDFIRTLFDQNPSEAHVMMLVEELRIYGINTAANNYLAEIFEQCIKNKISPEAVGISEKPAIGDDRGNSFDELRLEDDSILTKQAVDQRVNSLDDLLELWDKQSKPAYFNWTEMLIKVIPGAESKALARFVSGLDLDTSMEQVIRIVNALSDYGHINIGRDLLHRTISNSRYCHWGEDYYSKGKMQAYGKLLDLDPVGSVRAAALIDFVDALPKMSTTAKQTMIGTMDQVFLLFDSSIDLQMLYAEINMFRDQLFDNESAVRLVDVKGEDDDNLLLAKLLFLLLTVPSQFEYTIYPILIDEQQKFEPIIRQLLRRLYDGGFLTKFLHLLHGLENIKPMFVKEFSDELLKLINNDRADIVLLASELIEGINIEELRKVPKRKLPITYTLKLKPERGLVDASKKSFDHISEEGYLKDTQDPLIYTQVIRWQILELAQISGFEEYNIANRIRQIGTDAQFPDWCKNITEQELREVYESTLDLKIPYSRPQIQKVFDGLGKVAMELYDLEYLDEDDLTDFVPDFDPALYGIRPVKRPSVLTPILSSSGSAPTADEKWAYQIDERYVTQVLPDFDGERYILAESTILRGMGDGSTIETRQAMLSAKLPILTSEFRGFLFTTDNPISDYEHIEEHGIVLYNNAHNTCLWANWLAVNPSLADAMGLQLSHQPGVFRWEDSSGKTVIESIFWQTGDPRNNNLHRTSETGYGWRVLITRKGIEKITDLFAGQPLIHYKRVERDVKFQQRRYGTFIDEKHSVSAVTDLVLEQR